MPQTQPRKIVIDTDPGIDDAVAILLALKSPEFDVLGITTVAGNIGIRTTTRNAGRILALESRAEVPVVAGSSVPLVRPGRDASDIHGNDGLGGIAFPEPLAEPAGEDAVAWLARTLDVQEAGSVDILALGPLTNIARLIRDHPVSARRIRRVIAMGGAVHEPGNVGPRAEFNIAYDPEAADVVFRAGLDFTLIPLDVTRRVRATHDYTGKLKESGKAAAMAAGDLIDAYFLTTSGGESRPLHDPCVMLFALDEGLFGCEQLRIAVDQSATRDAGSLDIDAAGGAIDVTMTVDSAGALELLFDRLAG